MEFKTNFVYKDRRTKPRYVYLKYKPILVGNILDVGADECYLKQYLNKDAQYLGIGLSGNPDDVIRWKKYCSTRNINNVIFKRFVSNTDVPKYLKSADVLIMPYKTNMKFKIMDINTTSPLKLFEYMASNRPIIFTNIPAISKVLEHNKSGLLAESNNIEQLSSYVVELLKDSEKSKRLSARAFENVQKHTWINRCGAVVSKWRNET